MTIKESKPLERGKLFMRLTDSCLNGKVVEDEIGRRGGVVWWVRVLFC